MRSKINKDDYFWFDYIFKIKSRDDICYTILLDKTTLLVTHQENKQEHAWALLEFNRCEQCPLSQEQFKYCPVAYNIAGLADVFADIYSTEDAEIIIHTEERTYIKKDSIQQGLRSILGILLATSGCPHMDMLKPMARFHLPFASMEETIYRHIGNYFISQYFAYLDGKKPDISLEQLIKKNALVDEVNHGICKRIEMINDADANKNALIILNAIGMMLDLEIKSKLDSLKNLFAGTY